MTILASNNSAFVCPKDLAFVLGDSDAAIFLQQIHYWLEHESGKIINGVRWIYNTYSQWLEEFPHLTEWRLRSIIKLLKAHDVLVVEQHEKKQYKRRCWYTIDYEALKALLGSNREIPTNRNRGISPIETEDSSDSSISQRNSLTKNTPIENNNRSVAEFGEWEEVLFDKDEHDLKNSASCQETDLNDNKTNQVEQLDSDPKDKSASSARYNNNLIALKLYGFELTKQLEKLAAKYSEKEIERSLEYLDECMESGQDIQKPIGWLTECLKDEWWHDSFKSKEEAAVAEQLTNQGRSTKGLDELFEELWLMIDEGFVEPMPTDRWVIEGLTGKYLKFTHEGTFVNWYDPSFQDDPTCFQSMNFSEAKRRFYAKR